MKFELRFFKEYKSLTAAVELFFAILSHELLQLSADHSPFRENPKDL